MPIESQVGWRVRQDRESRTEPDQQASELVTGARAASFLSVERTAKCSLFVLASESDCRRCRDLGGSCIREAKASEETSEALWREKGAGGRGAQLGYEERTVDSAAATGGSNIGLAKASRRVNRRSRRRGSIQDGGQWGPGALLGCERRAVKGSGKVLGHDRAGRGLASGRAWLEVGLTLHGGFCRLVAN